MTPTITREETETTTTFYVPITLRQVEEFKIELDGGFGIDASEHAEMLDEEGLLRIAATVEMTDQDYVRLFDLETLQGTLAHPEADWTSCLRVYHHAAGHIQRNRTRQNTRRVEDLARSLPVWSEMDAAMREAEGAFEQWIEEQGCGEQEEAA